MLVGVPGCGKSLSAKSISANWKLPLYRLDFATVQGSYVGQSEQQLKDALTTAENVSPASYGSMRLKRIIRSYRRRRRRRSVHQNGWTVSVLDAGMQKQVFVVATANDVSMLPSELLRRGRFDELFLLIFLPQMKEEIFCLYI